MPKKIDPAVKERALRMFVDHRQDYPSDTALAEAVARKLGVGRETARRWLVQADVNTGARPGITSDEAAEIQQAQGREPAAAGRTTRSSARPRFSSPGSSTPATADHGVHRRHAQPGSRGRVDLQGAHRAWLPGRRADLPVLEARPSTSGRPQLLGRGHHRRAARRPGHPRRALRSPEDDPLPAPARSPGGVLHRRSPDARPGHERGPPRQGRPDHRPGQGRTLAPGTCSTATSPHRHPTPAGSRTSPTAGPGPGSSTSPSSSTCSPNGSWAGTPPPTSAPTWS